MSPTFKSRMVHTPLGPIYYTGSQGYNDALAAVNKYLDSKGKQPVDIDKMKK